MGEAEVLLHDHFVWHFSPEDQDIWQDSLAIDIETNVDVDALGPL